ncbi:putative serine/threonine-protein kinase WNK5-like [Hibiscus syriacus]|uniref:Serine/threonine-protein kinase WNK5-like n=2 Tax=Hibiscus syriacus TaxID=106335 RepID=A0A6A3BMP7_HIBSY|nr:putative serine/threonine-protein kinase WNK5-like [Hibiscus syriacus]
MGDLRDWSPERNGVVEEERSSSSSSSSSNQAGIALEYWKKAEEATEGIIAQVQPTVVSEDRRKAVIDYVQQLLKNYLGCEVFPFGSVPLKTYLPDGDIDLTAFGGLNFEEALANDVCSVLERGDHNKAAEFVVKDVQLIRAEVKLVKCLVQNIVVDISFNQLGGLCTLCFLEQVDRLIGKDHLFKRSIILIKAWCYYESRILGAHHGLISTYALETLVLYIFHLFHSSLDGPLAVLYKFLDYFSKFDWESYCISLNGPIHISSLPDFVVETPENGGGDFLLSDDFLKQCVEMFSVPPRAFETNSRTFPQKHLNIVDPLRENNNLGRSVSKGNFFRIRSAFTYGARKLGRILSQAEESIAEELCKFFSNTLDRHGSGQRPDVQDPAPLSRFCGFGATSSFSGADSVQDQTFYESESSNSTNATSVSGIHPSLDTEDLATSKIRGLVISNDAKKPCTPSAEGNISSSDNVWHAPHLYFSSSSLDNGDIKNGNEESKQPESSGFAEKSITSSILPATWELGTNVHGDLIEKQLVNSQGVQSPVGLKHHSLISNSAWSSENLYPAYSGYPTSISAAGIQEALSSLSDLCGDYDSHFQSLNYGRWFYGYALSASVPPISSSLVSQFQGKNSWEVIRKFVQWQNAISPMNANGVVAGQAYYPMNPPMLHGASFGMDEMPKPRGTGTYFPNPNTNHYWDRSLTSSGRSPAPARSPRNNGHSITSLETSSPERSSHELAQVLSVNQGGKKFGSSELRHSSSKRVLSRSASGPIHQPDRVVEFGSIGPLPLGSTSPEGSKQLNPGSPHAQNSSASHPQIGMPRPKSAMSINQNRVLAQSFHLKNEEDFPPLSI